MKPYEAHRMQTGDRSSASSVQTASALREHLKDIDRKSYPAYKGLMGSYRFPLYTLFIDHVQGDPFASPSHLSIFISHETAGFASELYETEPRQTALEDYLLRSFAKEAERHSFEARGSGKSGLISVSRCGQEILKRTACEITDKGIWVRFHVGFPANGRTIHAAGLEQILFFILPECVEQTLLGKAHSIQKLQETADLADDQAEIRRLLPELGLAAFVRDGAVLPRSSGVSDAPMKGGIPFQSPESLKVTMELPHAGRISGMGIPCGITLIAGGGYHGKSTLLSALEMGVYNHIAGDGREYVITEQSALKLRAEDGRFIYDTDISMFINDLPNGKDTCHFSTEDASGSTSQAAGITEGILSGCHTFLIDEDTSAANFMVRDQLMQRVISRKKEPITPFVERAEELYTNLGISTILVAGSSGAFFRIADTVIQMDQYRPVDITDKVHKILQAWDESGKDAERAEEEKPEFSEPDGKRPYQPGNQNLKEAKIRPGGKHSFSIERNTVTLHALEQIADEEQTAALSCLLRYLCVEKADGKRTLTELMDLAEQEQMRFGWSEWIRRCRGGSYIPSGYAVPRKQELYACMVRFRRDLRKEVIIRQERQKNTNAYRNRRR